jgi:multidrug efflux pump subunit AcrB
MRIKSLVLMGAAALSIGIGAIAGELDTNVVSVHYSVRENDAEKLEKAVSEPVQRSMQKLDRVVQIMTTTSHGVADVEVYFRGGATAQDVAAVTAQIDMLKFGEDLVVLSRVVELRPPRILVGP